MRSDWVPLSASALVTGVMALVLGTLLNPTQGSSRAGQTLEAVVDNSGRWLAMAVLFFAASVALTLGLPAVLSLFARRARGRRLGMLAVGVFTVGTIGTAGYAMLMVFFRALVHQHALRPALLEGVSSDRGFRVFLYGWIGGFYAGLLLLALALFRARSAPLWVPALLVAFVACFPVSNALGRVATAVQMMLLAIAFTGLAIAATTPRRPAGAVTEQPL